MSLKEKVKNIFDSVIDVVFSIILVVIIISIALGTFQLFFSVWDLIKLEGITGHYIDIITDVLTLYILIELSRSLIEYFSSHKLRLTFIVDAAIVFVIREILIILFKHKMEPGMLYEFSALLFVLGMIRIGSILVHQYEKKMESH
ncbi:phosphate-starvation-inducible PsiE family protein [Marinicellulosiphila megalodicopiae]|uniref:phosphate-starvation-inducible PsiE family protein n=1 Tax=Marinicellulosiphila megalodicopiae TaxID=2724896 RepID=UPI003BB221B1